jgi:hypothetical protein
MIGDHRASSAFCDRKRLGRLFIRWLNLPSDGFEEFLHGGIGQGFVDGSVELHLLRHALRRPYAIPEAHVRVGDAKFIERRYFYSYKGERTRGG